MADDKLLIVSLIVRHVLLRKMAESINPLFFLWVVSERHKRQVLWQHGVPYMCIQAVWPFGAKSEHVVHAEFAVAVMPEDAWTSAKVVAEFTEALVVVRTSLLLLRVETLFRLGMAVHTVFLLVAYSVLLDELANRHLVHIELMQEITLVPALARVPKPVNTHLLLSFLVTDLVLVRLHMNVDFVEPHLLVDLSRHEPLVFLVH